MKRRLSIVKAPTRMDEIHAALTGYWENDRWDVYDPFFGDIRPAKWSTNNRTMDFTRFGTAIKDEVKFFFAYRLQHKTMRLLTAFSYGVVLNRLAVFLNKIYPHTTSFVDIAYDKLLMQWRSHLIDQGFSVDKHGHQLSEHHETPIKQCYQFLQSFFDDRDEFEKDIWDVRRIPGARFTDNSSSYQLSFPDIPTPYRQLAKKYLKVRIGRCSQSQCKCDLLALRLFFKFIHGKYPDWQDIKSLSRKDMEDYLSWYRSYMAERPGSNFSYLISLRSFLAYIVTAGAYCPAIDSVICPYSDGTAVRMNLIKTGFPLQARSHAS